MKNKVLQWIMNKLFKSSSFIYNSFHEYEQVKQEEREFIFSFKWWLQWIMKVILLIIIIVITLMLFGGCSGKHVSQSYEPVYIPVECEVNVPPKPGYTGDILKDNLLIIKYSEELKAALFKCKKEGGI